MSIPFNFRTEDHLDKKIMQTVAQAKAEEDRYWELAGQYDARDWIAQAAEEASELAAALNKLNRTLGRGLFTPVQLEEAYDAVIEEWSDVGDSVETALKILYQQTPAQEQAERHTVCSKGPLSEDDFNLMRAIIKHHKHVRFNIRNGEKQDKSDIA